MKSGKNRFLCLVFAHTFQNTRLPRNIISVSAKTDETHVERAFWSWTTSSAKIPYFCYFRSKTLKGAIWPFLITKWPNFKMLATREFLSIFSQVEICRSLNSIFWIALGGGRTFCKYMHTKGTQLAGLKRFWLK